MTAKPLDGKVALITGASSGIGEAAAYAFADAGASLVLGARRTSELESIARKIRDRGGRVEYLRTDVTSRADLDALVTLAVDSFGGLDIAFNNAGVEGTLGPVVEDTDANFDLVFDVNVKGVWNSIRAELPAIVKRKGVIINTTSVVGHKGFANFSTYSASKAAVEGYTKAIALEVAEAGVRVLSVAPGPIETDMYQRVTGGDPSALVPLVPQKRLGAAEEVARAVVFLASDAASYITGQSIQVDGGMIAT